MAGFLARGEEGFVRICIGYGRFPILELMGFS